MIVTRSTASVPDCPNWTDDADSNYANATSRNYGCATNSNYAAMVANPEDLIRGQTNEGNGGVSASNRAIQAYRSGGSQASATGASSGSTTTSTGSSPD